jgi:hypothetical protein
MSPKKALVVTGHDDDAGRNGKDEQAIGMRPEYEQAIEKRLEQLGYRAVMLDCGVADVSRAGPAETSFVILSPEATPQAARKFRDAAVPVIAMCSDFYPEMGLTGSNVNDFGEEAGVENVLIINTNHPMAADLEGSLGVSQKAVKIGWGLPGRDASTVATLTTGIDMSTGNSKAVLFCYERDETMFGLNAPARRVGIFYDPDFAGHMEPKDGAFVSPYWRLFDAAVEWAAGEQPRQFADVFRAEWSEIKTRRCRCKAADDSGQEPRPAQTAPPTTPPENLAGLALSGGGIRAATFSLGLLQGLHARRLLPLFDYLSTVSGGGYIGGWWSAWLSRPPQDQRGGGDIFPPPEMLRSEDEEGNGHEAYAVNSASSSESSSAGVGRSPEARTVNSEIADEILSAGRDPVHHLRLFSNYLTPRKGILSPDTWRAVTVFSRDLILTWVVLLPILIAAMLLGKLYFVLQSYSYKSGHLNFFFNYDTHSQNVLYHFGKFAGFAALQDRLVLTLWPLLIILIWLAVTVCMWMIVGDNDESRREWWAGKFGGAVVAIMIALGIYVLFLQTDAGTPGVPRWFWLVMIAGALVLLIHLFHPSVRRRLFTQRSVDTEEARQWRGEVLRFRVTRAQSRLVTLFVLAAFVLLLGGFGHELVNYFTQEKVPLVARAGGWLAVLSALAGSIFTALKNSPSGGSDERLLDENQSAFNRLVFRVTPTLVLLVLAVVVSWAASALLNYMHLIYLGGFGELAEAKFTSTLRFVMAAFAYAQWKDDQTNFIPILMIATGFGALLSLYFVLVETRWRNSTPRRWLAALWIVLALYMTATLAGMLSVRPGSARCLNQPNLSFLADDKSVKPSGPEEAAGQKGKGEDRGDYDAEQSDAAKELVTLGVMPDDAGKKLLTDAENSESRDPLDWTCFTELYVNLDRRLLGIIFLISYVAGWQLIFRLRAGERREPRRLVPSVLTLFVGIILAVLSTWGAHVLYRNDVMYVELWLIYLFGGALLYCLLFVTLESSLGSGDNKRALWLLTSVYVILNALLMLSLVVDYGDSQIHQAFTGAARDFKLCTSPLAFAICTTFSAAPHDLKYALDFYIRVMLGEGVFCMFGASLTWVVAMGWMADPNRLSLHEFYRSRLVRAYLGASNNYRRRQLKTIRETVEGDDVRLQDLKNCQRGAPYHLVNTTLNLVGGRDLTTAQRSADAFVLSKRFCGSSRTGYRDTREYMDGRLALGTAVAVSGAAASPNMGSKTLTSSLAMLMTFLNVRLGYWAPTPNKKDWRETRARLWPFYMLREFTSQTNDLSTYCYLTDGGHFDNTGLYSLVERGCRLIVVADCGADPKPCFQDVGDALRRCRIDFGAEIDLDLAPLMRGKDSGFAESQFVVGSIVYSPKHLESLYRETTAPADDAADEEQRRARLARTGVIILFKPGITNRRETADVRQYKLENPVFPQQTTVDQWFDEAQFESYRRLGSICADALFGELEDLTTDEDRHAPKAVESLMIEASRKFDPRSPFKDYDPRPSLDSLICF